MEFGGPEELRNSNQQAKLERQQAKKKPASVKTRQPHPINEEIVQDFDDVLIQQTDHFMQMGRRLQRSIQQMAEEIHSLRNKLVNAEQENAVLMAKLEQRETNGAGQTDDLQKLIAIINRARDLGFIQDAI
ncbi:hypothetical protein ACFQI7_27725 [Paenibacillus allorhizosphaerae]|uniref:hypothetical protein n=1 Tax=Paenibacillus allorhizosphaerae TaxID=2849866 RepID=UPI001C407D82|nr:hypothetical protein [Paenibacillus allorhizosphaerae]